MKQIEVIGSQGLSSQLSTFKLLGGASMSNFLVLSVCGSVKKMLRSFKNRSFNVMEETKVVSVHG